MKKALLIGNGFTLYLIQEYNNSPMMNSMYKRIPRLINRSEKDFSIFRNLSFKDSDLYNISEALFCGSGIYCGDNLYPSDDGIHITRSSRTWTIERLSN